MNFPHLSSNIPSGPAYGVYISQLVCIGRICSDYSDFALRHYKLKERLINQGYRYSSLCRAFHKFAKKDLQIITKYNCTTRKHVEDGICLPTANSFLSRHISCRYSFFNISIFLFFYLFFLFFKYIYFFYFVKIFQLNTRVICWAQIRIITRV